MEDEQGQVVVVRHAALLTRDAVEHSQAHALGVARIDRPRDFEQARFAQHPTRGVLRLGQGVRVKQHDVPFAQCNTEKIIRGLVVDAQRQVRRMGFLRIGVDDLGRKEDPFAFVRAKPERPRMSGVADGQSIAQRETRR